MKKFYFSGMVLVCLICTTIVNGQQRFWVGPVSGTPGNWNDPNNWSATSGSGAPASVPNSNSFDVIFDLGALVNVDIASFSLNSITVQNSSTATLIATSAATITVESSTVGSEGLRIETGSRLEDSCAADVAFSLTFAAGARGWVDGTWYFAGASGVNEPEGATFTLPAVTGEGNRIDVNGDIIFTNNTRVPLPGPGPGAEYLFFNSGSEFRLDRNFGGTPEATWDANATIHITGVTTAAPTINLTATPQIGNLVIDCPDLDALSSPVPFSLPSNLQIQGNLEVLNTNGVDLVLISSLDAGPVNITVDGNFDISGNTSLYLAEDNTRSYTLQVNGNFNLSGGDFLMQLANGVGANTTVLGIAGNLNHTGGTFDCTSSDVSNTTDLFVVEMNGSGAQTITSASAIDNANNMITLRINNSNVAGVTLLSPVAIGKLSWNSANGGVIFTSVANYLTINNPDATNPTVINSPSNSGYVSGPVRRLTNSTGTYRFPTGKDGVYRYCEVIPETNAASTYSAEYFDEAHPTSSVILPLSGVSDAEYWIMSRISGSSARIQLTLNGAINGATASDDIGVARFNGANWVSAVGPTGTVVPGLSTTGVVFSDVLAAFNAPFTFGFGPAGALPINLVSFNAKKLTGNRALVTWKITANSTPDRFEVLRSADGNNFQSIGAVPGVEFKVNYEFTDNSLPAGTSYYRLRMIDVNGEVKLSKIVVVTNGTEGLFLTAMIPTIVTDRARVSVSSSDRGNLQLVVTDMFGRIVKQQINGIDAGTQEIWMDLRALPAGTYNVTGFLNGKRSSVIRFIRQ